MGDGATSVLVKHLEGCLQLLLADQVAFVHSRHDELGVVDGAIAINVNSVKHLVKLFICHLYAEMLFIPLGHFLLVE